MNSIVWDNSLPQIYGDIVVTYSDVEGAGPELVTSTTILSSYFQRKGISGSCGNLPASTRGIRVI